MITIQKKVVIDENGNPTDVIIPWKQFKELEEILGLDFDEKTRDEIIKAKEERLKGRRDSYIDIDDV